MNVSAKTEYACIALWELALQYESGQPVQVRKIVAAHGIPAPFLVQILLQLKTAGLVASTRGASGGYRLVKPPHEITLGDVVGVIERPAVPPEMNAERRTQVTQALSRVWQELADTERALLDSTTLADLIQTTRGLADTMYYI